MLKRIKFQYRKDGYECGKKWIGPWREKVGHFWGHHCWLIGRAEIQRSSSWQFDWLLWISLWFDVYWLTRHATRSKKFSKTEKSFFSFAPTFSVCGDWILIFFYLYPNVSVLFNFFKFRICSIVLIVLMIFDKYFDGKNFFKFKNIC